MEGFLQPFISSFCHEMVSIVLVLCVHIYTYLYLKIMDIDNCFYFIMSLYFFYPS